ncbi:hypothetical protein DFS34DRAFT_573088, partial [Phlyctochytrium arcticum]
QNMYNYCEDNDLPEVWAYLWENWYRKGRWELWARCVHEEIPVLRTTMMIESHWSRLKRGFLHQFHMPRCDLLIWILITKLEPTYSLSATTSRKLDRLLSPEHKRSRYREPPVWRKAFKKMWRKLETTAVPQPTNDKYQPDAHLWKCTCPSFVINRFLICKHLVQRVHRVPVVFFWEVKRRRTAPYWQHPSLRVIYDDVDDDDNDEENGEGLSDVRDAADEGGCIPDAEDHADDEDDDQDDDEESDSAQEEEMTEICRIVSEFARGLEYHVQFRDHRMLSALKREGASFLRMARGALKKESTRGRNATTWDSTATNGVMFYRARPSVTD